MTVFRWVILLSCVAFAYVARVVFIPIFLSVFLAMLLEPVVETMAIHGIRRKAAATVIVSVFVVFAALATWGLYVSSVSLIGDLAVSPRVAAVASYLQKTAGSLESSTKTLLPLSNPILEHVQRVEVIERVPGWMGFLLSAFGSFFEAFSVAVFVPLLLFYFLYDKENLVESLNNILGSSLYLPTLNTELPNMIRAFFVANIVTVGGLIFCQAVAYYFLGFDNWLPLAVIAGFLNILPIVGAILAIIIPIAMGIMHTGIEFPYIAIILFTLVVHFLFNNLILPVLIGARININTASLVVGLLFWSWLWGGLGFLIAIPMTALIKIFLDSNSSMQPIANLMSARPIVLISEPGEIAATSH